MLKWLGMAAGVGLSVCFGMIVQSSYKSEWLALTALEAALREMGYAVRHAPLRLAEVFMMQAVPSRAPFDGVFCRAAEEIRNGMAADGAWEEALRARCPEFSQEAAGEIARLAGSFGALHRDALAADLMAGADRIGEAAGRAQKRYAEKGAMARRLSVAAGLFIAILAW